MKLLFIFFTILALSLAEKAIVDLEAQEANINIAKEGLDEKSSANYRNYWVTGSPIHTRPVIPTTTSVPVIKQEQYIGPNGQYSYEYKLGDGTHVGETGYFADAERKYPVKKGWYSYVAPNGKTYTVTYWADYTGFHAYGEHLPTPPPPPITARPIYHDEQPAQTPKPTPPPYVPTQPPYVPTQPPYVPTQPPYVPTHPPHYPPQVPPFNHFQQYYPPQQTYYPQVPNYNA